MKPHLLRRGDETVRHCRLTRTREVRKPIGGSCMLLALARLNLYRNGKIRPAKHPAKAFVLNLRHRHQRQMANL